MPAPCSPSCLLSQIQAGTATSSRPRHPCRAPASPLPRGTMDLSFPIGAGSIPKARHQSASACCAFLPHLYFNRRESQLTHSPSVSHILPPCLSFPLPMQLNLPTREFHHHHPDAPFPPLSLPAHTALDQKQRVLIYGHFCALPRTQRRKGKNII